MARPNFNYPGGRAWSEEDLNTLRSLFSDTHNVELATLLGRTEPSICQMSVKLGLRKSQAYKDAHSSKFQPGLVPWNTGMSYQAGGRSRETQFKPGQKPLQTMPVGSYRVTHDGTLQMKVNDDPGPPFKRWRSVTELVWIEHNGPVPDGHVVVFKDGCRTADPEQITIDRVECITRAEVMKRNSAWTRLPPELARMVQLRGALHRQINKMSRKEEEKST